MTGRRAWQIVLAAQCADDPALAAAFQCARTPLAALGIATLASLSGWLDECESLADLLDAAKHGATCINSGVFSPDDFERESELLQEQT